MLQPDGRTELATKHAGSRAVTQTGRPVALSLSRWRRDSFGDICYQNQASASANVAVPACPAPRLGYVPCAGVAAVALLLQGLEKESRKEGFEQLQPLPSLTKGP